MSGALQIFLIQTAKVRITSPYQSSARWTESRNPIIFPHVERTRGRDKERGFPLLIHQSRNINRTWLRALKWNSGFGSYSLYPVLYCLLTSSRAAAKPLRTKEENHKRVACAPLLRFSPFEIPFPYLPPGSLHVGRFYRISAFCPTRGGSVG